MDIYGEGEVFACWEEDEEDTAGQDTTGQDATSQDANELYPGETELGEYGRCWHVAHIVRREEFPDELYSEKNFGGLAELSDFGDDDSDVSAEFQAPEFDDYVRAGQLARHWLISKDLSCWEWIPRVVDWVENNAHAEGGFELSNEADMVPFMNRYADLCDCDDVFGEDCPDCLYLQFHIHHPDDLKLEILRTEMVRGLLDSQGQAAVIEMWNMENEGRFVRPDPLERIPTLFEPMPQNSAIINADVDVYEDSIEYDPSVGDRVEDDSGDASIPSAEEAAWDSDGVRTIDFSSDDDDEVVSESSDEDEEELATNSSEQPDFDSLNGIGHDSPSASVTPEVIGSSPEILEPEITAECLNNHGSIRPTTSSRTDKG